jgi:hypothetical protein
MEYEDVSLSDLPLEVVILLCVEALQSDTPTAISLVHTCHLYYDSPMGDLVSTFHLVLYSFNTAASIAVLYCLLFSVFVILIVVLSIWNDCFYIFSVVLQSRSSPRGSTYLYREFYSELPPTLSLLPLNQ